MQGTSDPSTYLTWGCDNIATDHGPMVQRKLLTVHPGSIHGGEETPEGGSSLRQGAGKRSTSAADLGSAAAAEQRQGGSSLRRGGGKRSVVYAGQGKVSNLGCERRHCSLYHL